MLGKLGLCEGYDMPKPLRASCPACPPSGCVLASWVSPAGECDLLGSDSIQGPCSLASPALAIPLRAGALSSVVSGGPWAWCFQLASLDPAMTLATPPHTCTLSAFGPCTPHGWPWRRSSGPGEGLSSRAQPCQSWSLSQAMSHTQGSLVEPFSFLLSKLQSGT